MLTKEEDPTTPIPFVPFFFFLNESQSIYTIHSLTHSTVMLFEHKHFQPQCGKCNHRIYFFSLPGSLKAKHILVCLFVYGTELLQQEATGTGSGRRQNIEEKHLSVCHTQSSLSLSLSLYATPNPFCLSLSLSLLFCTI